MVLSDLQIPYHDTRAVKAMLGFVKAYRPDELACVGDEIDAPEPSRWSKGSAEEFAPTLQAGIDKTHEVLAAFRAALGKDKPFVISRSNHADRLETYIRRYAPAFSGLRSLRIETLLGYDTLGIEYRRTVQPIAPGWVMAHGDEGSLSRYAGGTAVGLAKRFDKSVVCGHTHRAGIINYSVGVNGRTRTVTGLEIGHLMDMRKAAYLKTGSADWQQAFGILYVDGRDVTPSLIPIRYGRFTVEGKTYGG